jgi:hypothetical protein
MPLSELWHRISTHSVFAATILSLIRSHEHLACYRTCTLIISMTRWMFMTSACQAGTTNRIEGKQKTCCGPPDGGLPSTDGKLDTARGSVGSCLGKL